MKHASCNHHGMSVNSKGVVFKFIFPASGDGAQFESIFFPLGGVKQGWGQTGVGVYLNPVSEGGQKKVPSFNLVWIQIGGYLNPVSEKVPMLNLSLKLNCKIPMPTTP